jgi:hypothetical protein
MIGRYLSFRTADVADEKAWSQTGKSLLLKFAEGLKAKGYLIDMEVGRDEPDWVFSCSYREDVFVVSMSIMNVTTCRWMVFIQNRKFSNLAPEAIRNVVFPVLYSIVASWPKVSELRWHDDHTTLTELEQS